MLACSRGVGVVRVRVGGDRSKVVLQNCNKFPQWTPDSTRILVFALQIVCVRGLYQHGGGSCSTNWDCSLGGICRNGVCACDVWFTGKTCALLNLARASPTNGLNISGWSTWGGHAVRSDEDDLWHGFFSLIGGECTLNAYRSNSGSVFATATSAEGPYKLANPAQPDSSSNWAVAPPSHCTQIKRHPSGEYHLWHILPGNGAGHMRNCSHEEHTRRYNTSSFSQNLWVHTAPSPNGPWSKVGTQINVTGLLNGTTAQQTWCSAPYYYPNGTSLLIWGGQHCPNKPPFKSGGCLWAGVADDWRGPYRQANDWKSIK